MKTKYVSLLLVLVLALLLLPGISLRAEAETYSGSCGDNLSWSLDTETGLLTISGTGPMTGWHSTGSVPWQSYNVKDAVIEEGVTSLSFGAFYYKYNLQSVSLPSTLTAIDDRVFQACSSLASIQLPAGLRSLGSYAFSGCTQLQSVRLPQGLSSVSTGLFRSCVSLTEVELPAGLRSIYSSAFSGCSSLESLSIPESCNSIGYDAFASSGLRSLSIPASVTSIGSGAFANCAGLTEISVAADNPNYCAIGGVLFNKAGTSLLQYPAGRPGAYVVPDGTASIAANAFEGSTELSALTLNQDLTEIGAAAFRGCSALSALAFPQGVTALPNEVCRGCNALVELTIPEQVASLGASAFLDCKNLEMLTVLNPSCVFPSGSLVPALTTIQGYMESTAHDYAEAQGLRFDPIDGCNYGLHVYALAEQVQRTEQTDGYRLFRCQRCEAERTDVFPAWNNYPPLAEGVSPLPPELVQAETLGGSEQYLCQAIGGLYFRENDQLYCWFPRSGELYSAYSFPEGSLYYCTGDLLYALSGEKVTVYGLTQMDVLRSVSLPQVYAFTAIGADAEGRIYAAGQTASNNSSSIYLYDAQGTLLSELPLGNLVPVRCFDGFDPVTGRFYLESRKTWYVNTSSGWITYYGSLLVPGLVEDGVLSLESVSTSVSLGGKTTQVPGLNYSTPVDGHWRCAELLGGRTLVSVSLSGMQRRVHDPDAPASYWGVSCVEDPDGQGGTLAGVGARSVWLEERGTILGYDGGCMLREYDPETHDAVSFFQTAHPVFSLFQAGQWVLAVEQENGACYIELIDWSSPTQLSVSPTALSMTLGEELTPITIETNRSYISDYQLVPADPGTVFSPDGKRLVATNPGATQLRIVLPGGGPSATVPVQVADRAQLPTGSAATADAVSNQGLHSYNVGSAPVRSYLSEQPDGSLERVCYDTANSVLLCTVHAADGTELSRQALSLELPLFGGYFRGADGRRYVVCGQTNPEDSDEQEVLRVVRYNADWTRLDACSIYGANTYTPFFAGSLRMAEADGRLYIHTCHKMYLHSDGLRHQANMTFILDEATLSVTASSYIVSGFSTGYVSHSFNQFILADGDRIYRLDHGDAYPRALCVTLTPVGDSLKPTARNESAFPIQGGTGVNATGVSAGDLTVSDYSVLFAGNSVDQSSADSYSASGQRNIFVVNNSKDLTAAEIHWFTDYTAADGVTPGAPFLVRIAQNQFLLLWEEYRSADQSYAVSALRVNADGTAASVRYLLPNMRLSDCEPILCADGTVCWYAGNGSTMSFYRLDPYHLNTWPGSSCPDYRFLDVQDPDAYFYTPVYWAMKHDPQITSGTDETHFSPFQTCTREQIVTFLWHAMGNPEPLTEPSLFTDVNESAYYRDAVRWAQAQGVTSGVANGLFGVGQGCTRAQVVSFLWKALGAPEPTATETDFIDVTAGKYYYKAVLWAVENGITAGTSPLTFGPNDTCTRAQIVTFLYKAINSQ